MGHEYYSTAHAISCQVKPSEYAYRGDSVNRAENVNANCRRYPDGPGFQEQYIHCNGTQLKLTDSNLGQDQYQAAVYYLWSAGSDARLLFIFHTRVTLTTITLHYYSDNVRSVPRLTFYAVPDDFDIWDVPSIWSPHIDVAAVPPGREPVGRRSVSISINFTTNRVLMYKFSSSFMFAVSEVEFFTCCGK